MVGMSREEEESGVGARPSPAPCPRGSRPRGCGVPSVWCGPLGPRPGCPLTPVLAGAPGRPPDAPELHCQVTGAGTASGWSALSLGRAGHPHCSPNTQPWPGLRARPQRGQGSRCGAGEGPAFSLTARPAPCSLGPCPGAAPVPARGRGGGQRPGAAMVPYRGEAAQVEVEREGGERARGGGVRAGWWRGPLWPGPGEEGRG